MPNTALYNDNSPHSTQTRGHSDPLFQMPQIWRPINGVSAVDLKSAADTVVGLFLVPPEYGAVQIVKFGFHTSAAGGAVTAGGSLKLTIGGVDVMNADEEVIELAIAADSELYEPYEQHLNRTLRPDNLQAVPNYPYALANEAIQLRVGTQGSGSGAQTVWPYIVVRVHPRNGTLYPDGLMYDAGGTLRYIMNNNPVPQEDGGSGGGDLAI